MRLVPTTVLVGPLLRLLALQVKLRPSLRRTLRTSFGWLNFSVAFRTESGGGAHTIVFDDGRTSVRAGADPTATTTVVCRDESALRALLSLPPNEALLMMMRGEMRPQGNVNYLSLFNHLVSRARRRRHQAQLEIAATKGLSRESLPKRRASPSTISSDPCRGR